MAIRTGADIVPIAIEQYGKEYYVNIGRNIVLTDYQLNEKVQATSYLRDILCTLKWEIINYIPGIKRKNLTPNASEIFLDSIMSQTENGYTVEEILRTRYHEKNVSTNDAFRHLDRIEPNLNNAFLFKKMYK